MKNKSRTVRIPVHQQELMDSISKREPFWYVHERGDAGINYDKVLQIAIEESEKKDRKMDEEKFEKLQFFAFYYYG